MAGAAARPSPTSRTFGCAYIPTICFCGACVWELRNKLMAYDAAYVALADALNAPLLTRDRRLAAPAGHHARIALV
jgi:hypothetical protein